MRPEDSVGIGVGTLAACVIISGVLWFALFRLVRWILW